MHNRKNGPSRLEPLLRKLTDEGVDAFFVSDLHVIRWLTGFSGSSARVLLSPEKSIILTDFRYAEQVKNEVGIMEVMIVGDGYADSLAGLEFLQGKRVAVQEDHLTLREFGRLAEKLAGLTLVPVHGFFDGFRAIKSDLEVEYLKHAASISEQVLEKVVPLISPEVTEIEIAAEISYWHRRLGAEGDSFDPIVASGPRSALPHARPQRETFRPGSLIVMDFGCVWQGYASDQTRTFALGKVPREAKAIHDIVREAQQLGLDSARPGMRGSELDALVRGYIAERGYGEAFGHSLGHGVGIEVHESPKLGSKSQDTLPAGSVFTIEPGIYLPDRYGVRIEDTVLMGENGAVPFQRYTKELVQL